MFAVAPIVLRGLEKELLKPDILHLVEVVVQSAIILRLLTYLIDIYLLLLPVYSIDET